MSVVELRDAEEARHVLLQSYLLQRLAPPGANGVAFVLEWALDIAGAGVPLPPLGVLADLGNLLLKPHATTINTTTPIAGWSEHRALAYEDYVLGKWLADTSLERAGDAVRQYQGSDRGRGLAFVLMQLRVRCGFGGVLLSPAVLKKLKDQPGDQFVAAAWGSIEQFGLWPVLPQLFDDLESDVRRATAMLGPEDLFELEHRTALSDFSQRVALRQALQATAAFRATLSDRPPAFAVAHREVASHLRDEDTYPVGGFTSLSNRGTVESLLHSQLAYMEDDRPDLFDIKFLRDELLYYSRDENQFFRRRRTFVFVFFPDLIEARVKDADSAWQRIVMLLALTIAIVEQLSLWLGNDSLVFDFLFPCSEDVPPALEAERTLLTTIFQSQIANRTVNIATIDERRLAAHCEERARRSVLDGLLLSTGDAALDVDGGHISSIRLNGPELRLTCDGVVHLSEAENSREQWTAALGDLIVEWARR